MCCLLLGRYVLLKGGLSVALPEDVGERGQEGPEHDILQDQHDADGELLL
jgi:hypothetical protein